MNNKTIVSKPDMLINGSSNMQAASLDILDMTIPYINADKDGGNRTYVISVEDVYKTIGLPYDRFSYRRYKDLAHKDASIISIAFVDEFGRDVQLMPFDKITWLDDIKSMEINISESFKEIMAEPSLSRTKYRLIDFLALKSKYAKQAFSMLMVRFTKSNNGKRLITFKQEGNLKGCNYLDIWPIKKTRKVFRLKENSYQAGQIKELFNRVCEEISTSTDYFATVDYNYHKDKNIKNAQTELTHICWRLTKKTATIGEKDPAAPDAFVNDIIALGYNLSEAAALSAALARNGQDMDYFKNLHDYLSNNTGSINNAIGWLLSGIEHHYTFRSKSGKKKSGFNDFQQRTYDMELFSLITENKLSDKEYDIAFLKQYVSAENPYGSLEALLEEAKRRKKESEAD